MEAFLRQVHARTGCGAAKANSTSTSGCSDVKTVQTELWWAQQGRRNNLKRRQPAVRMAVALRNAAESLPYNKLLFRERLHTRQSQTKKHRLWWSQGVPLRVRAVRLQSRHLSLTAMRRVVALQNATVSAQANFSVRCSSAVLVWWKVSCCPSSLQQAGGHRESK